MLLMLRYEYLFFALLQSARVETFEHQRLKRRSISGGRLSTDTMTANNAVPA